MKLSNTTIKEADRVGGALLLIPWPADMPPGPALRLGRERAATPAEHRRDEQILAQELARIAAERKTVLVPVRTIVTRRAWPPGTPLQFQEAQFLGAIVIGERWVRATGPRAARPAECWVRD